jgi:basic amino acid/polyamine antiporter, APA family
MTLQNVEKESGNSSFHLATAAAAGLMLSPESLVFLGNSMGTAGPFFLLMLLGAAGLQLLTGRSYGILWKRYPGPGGEARAIREALGSFPAFAFPICSRVFLSVWISTGILATAGYVFNEVFFPTVPNLAFSFCLLALLLLLNLPGRKLAETAQFIFVAWVFCGLVLLSAAGLLQAGNAPFPEWAAPQTAALRSLFPALFLFIGFDLAGFRGKNSPGKAAGLSRVMFGAILGAAFLFFLWGMVSVRSVPLERLSGTTVPHMAAARSILGEMGRMWMGTVLLASACGAVNILLAGVPRMIVGMAEERILPAFLGRSPWRSFFPLLLLVAGVAAALGLGMAGSPMLDPLIRAGFLLWLANYAVVHLGILRLKIQGGAGWSLPAAGLFVSSFGFIGILVTDVHPAFLLKSMVAVLAFACVLSFLWNRPHRETYQDR